MWGTLTTPYSSHSETGGTSYLFKRKDYLFILYHKMNLATQRIFLVTSSSAAFIITLPIYLLCNLYAVNSSWGSSFCITYGCNYFLLYSANSFWDDQTLWNLVAIIFFFYSFVISPIDDIDGIFALSYFS